jgi:hypothetical protein
MVQKVRCNLHQLHCHFAKPYKESYKGSDYKETCKESNLEYFYEESNELSGDHTAIYRQAAKDRFKTGDSIRRPGRNISCVLP